MADGNGQLDGVAIEVHEYGNGNNSSIILVGGTWRGMGTVLQRFFIIITYYQFTSMTI